LNGMVGELTEMSRSFRVHFLEYLLPIAQQTEG